MSALVSLVPESGLTASGQTTPSRLRAINAHRPTAEKRTLRFAPDHLLLESGRCVGLVEQAFGEGIRREEGLKREFGEGHVKWRPEYRRCRYE
jgi:hypothetical protein